MTDEQNIEMNSWINSWIINDNSCLSHSRQRKIRSIRAIRVRKFYETFSGNFTFQTIRFKNKKRSRSFLIDSWKRRLPTLPKFSTIGDSELNFSVRNGKRWDLAAITTLMPYITFDYAKDGKNTETWRNSIGQLVSLGWRVATLTPVTYRRRILRRPSWGDLISWLASRLDAFSAYPNPT